jgi:hypothetical protein
MKIYKWKYIKIIAVGFEENNKGIIMVRIIGICNSLTIDFYDVK